jgi:hypothetical protein
VLTAALFFLAVQPVRAQSLVLDQRIEVPSVQGRLDHMDIDIKGGRLFVAALGADSVELIDLRASKRTARLQPLHEPQGVVYLPESRRLFVANGAGGGVQAFADGKAPAIASAEGLDDADNLRIRAAETQNFPMALDEPSHRLLVATRRPPALLAWDTVTGKRVAELPICGDADDLFFDGQRHQLYAICGEGLVQVIRQRDPDHYEVVQRVATAPGARTGLFVPSLSTLYVAAPSHSGAIAEVRAFHIR